MDSLHSIKNRWKSKIKTNKKCDSEKLSSISRKWKENTIDKKKEALKRGQSKSFDDELEPTDKVLIDSKQSYSCSEIPQLSSIKEEGDQSLKNIGQSKTYRRKMFARCKTQEVTMSFSPASSLKSLKSSNASLSSCEPLCIITVSSPESTAPPLRIFPGNTKERFQ